MRVEEGMVLIIEGLLEVHESAVSLEGICLCVDLRFGSETFNIESLLGLLED
jgi:hypothetical protein